MKITSRMIKMLLFLTAALLILGDTLGSPLANQYVENVLNTAFITETKNINLDPTILPDFEIQFEDKVRIIGTVKGKAKFDKGILEGLSQAKRHSECEGVRIYGTESRTINCTISFEDIKFNYEGKMKYGKMPKVSIKGKGKIAETLVRIEIVHLPPMVPSLKTFSFAQLGKLKVKFSGLGPLNRFTEALEDGFKGSVQAEIFNNMNQKVQYALSRAISQVYPPPI